MKAVITGEIEDLVGVNLRDNDGVEHVLDVRKSDGEITAHQQDGYPDEPSERSPDGVRNVTQAQQYAKYYVYKDCGYPTISLQEDPDRITLVALIVAAMDTDTFEEYFGDFYQQFRYHHEDEDPAIEIPDDLYTEDVFYYYTTEIFLGLDETAEADLIEQLQDETVQEYLEEAESITGSGDVAAIADELSALATEHGFGGGELQTLAPEQWIETTSGLHVKWEIGDEIYGEFNDEPDLDRGPDAELELVPHEPESMEALQEYAVHN
ncbi:hypothetical protein, partial [Natrialba chahannaoensis]|uniref:hypothetical protein n=1 Tax=Natrialba chahannaoensis TaxID=68911 RepID=UPI000677B4D6